MLHSLRLLFAAGLEKPLENFEHDDCGKEDKDTDLEEIALQEPLVELHLREGNEEEPVEGTGFVHLVENLVGREKQGEVGEEEELLEANELRNRGLVDLHPLHLQEGNEVHGESLVAPNHQEVQKEKVEEKNEDEDDSSHVSEEKPENGQGHIGDRLVADGSEKEIHKQENDTNRGEDGGNEGEPTLQDLSVVYVDASLVVAEVVLEQLGLLLEVVELGLEGGLCKLSLDEAEFVGLENVLLIFL